MDLGERIKNLRQDKGFSQERVAELIGVSRQAVTKWETNRSYPSTENLLKLAEIFEVSVDMLLGEGKEKEDSKKEEKPIKRFKKKKYIVIVVIAAIFFSWIGYVKSLPVDYDAGACSGGYTTFIFNKYKDELTEKFVNGDSEKEKILWAEAVEGSQEANWEERRIFLNFDIEYEHTERGVIKEKIHFIGNRVWFDTYTFGGAIIEG